MRVHHRRARLCAVAGTIVTISIAVISGLAVPASAAPSLRPTNNVNFSGYYATPAIGLASVSTTFKVPTINCSSGITQGVAFGAIADINSSTAAARSQVRAQCTGTTASYQLFVLANTSEFVENGVGPGDKVVASIFQTVTGISAEIHDLTSGFYYVADGSANGATGAGAGAEQITTPTPELIAPFATPTFTKAEVNGDYIGFDTPIRYDMATGSNVIMKAGLLTDGGDQFAVAFN